MITSNEKEQIKDLITEAEKRTSSEIVPMVITRSDDYPAAHFRGAIIISFLFSLALYFSPLSIINPIYFLWIQIPGLIVGYFLAEIHVVTRLLTSKQEIEHEVTQRAIEAFFHHGLHTTEKHNGVLIFISLLEHKIKIITDVGVKAKVDQKIWDEIIVAFTEKVQGGNLAPALKDAINATADVLENYFPYDGKESRRNELKNDLILE